MIRVLAASLSAAALMAASLPAEAQHRQHGPAFRAPVQTQFAVKRTVGPNRIANTRRFRSFNPPAPQFASGQKSFRSFNPPTPQAYSRGLTPPTPGGAVSPSIIQPGAPAGGQTLAGIPSGVPASLPPPSPGEASPTAAAQPTEAAPQGDLQPPIPETIASPAEPAVTTAKVDKLVPEQVVEKIVQVPQIVRYVQVVRVVHVPVYRERRIYRRHHVHVPHYAFRGHRAHFGPHIHFRIRRW